MLRQLACLGLAVPLSCDSSEGQHLSPPVSSTRGGSSFSLEACVPRGCRPKGCLCSREAGDTDWVTVGRAGCHSSGSMVTKGGQRGNQAWCPWLRVASPAFAVSLEGGWRESPGLVPSTPRLALVRFPPRLSVVCYCLRRLSLFWSLVSITLRGRRKDQPHFADGKDETRRSEVTLAGESLSSERGSQNLNPDILTLFLFDTSAISVHHRQPPECTSS